MDARLVRIPQQFFVDHEERDLDTPEIKRRTQKHFWISLDDPAIGELVSDAEHYAEGGISVADFPHLLGIVSSARATLNAIRKARGQ